MRDFDPTASEFIESGFIKNSVYGCRLYDPVSILGSVAGPIIGGVLGGDAAGDAAATQAASADRASAIQDAAQRRQEAALQPWAQGGGLAQNELLRRLGIGGSSGGGMGANQLSADQLRAQLVGQYTTAGQPIYDPYSNWETGRGWANGMQVPIGMGESTIDEAGLNAAIQQRLTSQGPAGVAYTAENDPQFGSLTRQFGQQDLDNDLVYQNTYQNALNTGVDAINSRAASAGGYGSGAALKALTKVAANTAASYTGDAYNRNMAEKNQQFGFLSGVSQQGQSAAAGTGAAGINTAAAIAGNTIGAGNATAAGQVGAANALSGGLAGAQNAYQWNQLLSKNTAAPAAYRSGSGLMNDLQSYGVF